MALQRVAGDDWKWHWTTDDDVSSWSDLVIQIRADHHKTATLIASNVAVEGELDEPNLFTDGSDDLNLPATDLDAGVLAFYVLAETTAGITRGPYLEIEAVVAGAKFTVMQFRPIRFREQVAVRPA